MTKPLTVTELKKELNKLDQKQLVDIIAKLYKIDEKAKDMLCVKMIGEAYQNELLETYKINMHNIFFPSFIPRMPSF